MKKNFDKFCSYLQRAAIACAVIGLIGTASIMVAQRPSARISSPAKPATPQKGQTAASQTDFTGDQMNDLVIFDAENAQWSVHNLVDETVDTFSFGEAHGVPVADDYDGDGVVDIAMVRVDGNELCWELRKSTGGAESIDWGLANDIPVKGDYDGDGRADVAVWRPSTGEWLALASSSAELIVLQLGTESDKAVPGDYDGDGVTDAAIFRPESAMFYFVSSRDQTRYARSWEVPVLAYDTSYAPADYDGDGITDLAIFTEKDGQYRIFASSTESYRLEVFPVGPRSCVDYMRAQCGRNSAQPADYDNDGVADPATWNNVSGKLFAIGSQSGSIELTTETGGELMTVSAYYTVR